MQKKIERIDLERVGASSLMIRKWYEGYNPEDAGQADIEEFLPDTKLDAELAKLEKQGYAVWITRSGIGHALRGPITRVDFIFDGEDWQMKKYPRGWKAQTRPIESKTFNETEKNAAVNWLKENGWTVIEWEDSYRAFKGKMSPVHDAHAIRQLRQKYPNAKYNLAYYY